MGQRLNIEIERKKDNKVLANCYYHWSAYTESSLELAKRILLDRNEIVAHNDKVSDEIKAIQLLQLTGAGMQQEEYEELDEETRKYTHICNDRNLGLISVSQEGIDETRNWQEEELTICVDFDNKEYDFKHEKDKLDFGVYWVIDKEGLKDYYEDNYEEIDLKNMVEFDFDLHDMSLDDICVFLSRIDEIENNKGLFKLKNDKNNIYGIIY